MRTASIYPTIPSIAWPTNPTLVPKRQDKPQSVRANVVRPTPQNSRQTLEGDDYGYDDIDDTELLQAAERAEGPFLAIDELLGNEMASQRPLGTQLWEPDRSPERLPNGKYSCHHHCKDKSRCKHLCCREGINKQRKKAKPRADGGLDFPKEAESVASKGRQLPLSFAGMVPVVDLTQRGRNDGLPEWSLASEADFARVSTVDRSYATQLGRHREPNPSAPLRNTPFKIPIIREPARLESQRTVPSSTQGSALGRPARTSPSAAPLAPAGLPRHFLDRDPHGASNEAVFTILEDAVDATRGGRRAGHERAQPRRKLDAVLEPASPAGRSKWLRTAGVVDRRADEGSSPMFVPLTPGSLASPFPPPLPPPPAAPGGDATAEDHLPPAAVSRPRASGHVRPAAAAVGGVVGPAVVVQEDFVNVHSVVQPVGANKENECKGSKTQGEKDALTKLREWLGDCVEFE
jgi:hypothetical protein